MRPLAIFLFVGMYIAAGQNASAASFTPNHDLDTILEKLRTNAGSDQYRQIVDAINFSPGLMDELNQLATSRKLTEISVVNSATTPSAPKPGPFNAWISGTSMVFTETLLNLLTKNREYDVISPDDILPDNTTFVIAHLAFHLNAEKIICKPGGVSQLNDYVAAMLDQEARAYIHSWNDALEAAVHQNHGNPLTPRQIANFMLNLHYRFVFVKALKQPTDPIHLEQNGIIDESESNAKALTTALKTSSLADIQ